MSTHDASGHREPVTRRWKEQRWLLDNTIRAVGADWDQPRLAGLNASLGPESNADIAGLRTRIQKFADLTPAFEAVARRREAKARQAEEAGQPVTARDNYYMAAAYWASAQWPIDENNEQHFAINRKKRECYERYVAVADHRIEAAWIPLGEKALPAWFHVPATYKGGRLPAVVLIPGMDGFKEKSVALYGDAWLNRGFAVLALEGPGQYECPTLGIYASTPAWLATGPAVMNWLAARAEVDAEKVCIVGSSFGALFATLAVSAEPRFRACAVTHPCLEPAAHTLFEEGSPTFKKRFMYMANFVDEAPFDEFAKTLTWEGHLDKIRMPYLCVAGSADELSPIDVTERMVRRLQGPKQFVIYQDSRHAVGNVPATNLGPSPVGVIADWMVARCAGESFVSERWLVDAAGRVEKTPL